jgi:hypothetical protein
VHRGGTVSLAHCIDSFGSWNLSDTKAEFIFLTCIWSQSENGMNIGRNHSVEEWRKKGKDSIMPDRISATRADQDVGKP